MVETVGQRSIEELPSTSTQARFASEMKALSREQEREEVEGETNLTLKYDGTTRGHLGYLAEVDMATKSVTFVTG